MIGEAVRRWYSSMSQNAAQLLQQAFIADKKRREQALAPINKIIDILATTLERDQKKTGGKSKFDHRTAARILVLALFPTKVSSSRSRDEKEAVESILQHWLQTVAVAL